jgi:uncharacterized protein
MQSTGEQLQQLLQNFRKEQLASIQSEAERGNPEAQFQLGALYANGRGVAQNSELAVHWLLLAANAGVVAAETLLAWCYQSGNGLPQSLPEAIHWYMRAAVCGDADAQCALGDLYREGGGGIEQQSDTMLKWYQAAAAQDHPKALYALGTLYEEGRLVPADDEQAFYYFTLAIMQQSEPAQRALQLLTARLDAHVLQNYRQRMLDRLAVIHH